MLFKKGYDRKEAEPVSLMFESNIPMLKNAGVDVAVVGNYAKKCYEHGNLAMGINRLLLN